MNLRSYWKLVVGLVILVVAGLWLTAPNLVTAAVPFLLVLACPLMMVFMHGGHGAHAGHDAQGNAQGASCHVSPGGGPAGAVSREARLAELQRQQQMLQVEIAELASDIERSGVDARPALQPHSKNGVAAETSAAPGQAS